jgi:hypothetical protein
MTLKPERTTKLRLSVFGASEEGKAALAAALHDRRRFATVRHASVGTQELHRLSWVDPEPLPSGERLEIVVNWVTGHPEYLAMEDYLVRAADGVFFLMDARPAQFREGWDALLRLNDLIRSQGLTIVSKPFVMLYFLPGSADGFNPAELDSALGLPPSRIARYVGSGVEPNSLANAIDQLAQASLNHYFELV